MSVIKSISVSEEFSQLAKTHHLSWSRASIIGMSIMLGDIDVMEYDNKLNFIRKFQEKLNKFNSLFTETRDFLEKKGLLDEFWERQEDNQKPNTKNG